MDGLAPPLMSPGSEEAHPDHPVLHEMNRMDRSGSNPGRGPGTVAHIGIREAGAPGDIGRGRVSGGGGRWEDPGGQASMTQSATWTPS